MNYFYIKNVRNFYIQYWLRRDTGETDCSEKLVAQGNFTLAKIVIVILMVKEITYNAKVSDIIIL